MANRVSPATSLLDSTDESFVLSPSVVTLRSGAATHVYIFYVDTTTNLRYVKSTDAGSTFGTPVTLDSGESWATVAIWYDRWTPSNTTGNLIHIVASSTTNDKIVYFSLDVSTDTAGTNNDVDILTWTDITPSPDGCVSICAGVNGDLYAGGIGGSGPVGLQVARSTDSGATWSDISSPASGTDMQAEFNDDLDVFMLMPLLTDDDIMLAGIDNSATSLDSYVFDAVAGQWAAAVQVAAGPEVASGLPQVFSISLDKTTGDLYFLYKKGSFFSADQTFFNKYSDSTRTFGTEVKILPNSEINTENSYQTMRGLAVCRDQTNGVLFIHIFYGDNGAAEPHFYFLSSDEGQTWGDEIRFRDFTDDFRSTRMPILINDTAEGWYSIWYNDDLNDIYAFNGTLEYKTVSGVVYDADGTTPLQNVEVRAYRRGYWQAAGSKGRIDTFMGSVLSDASGNYKIGVLGNQADDSDTESYYVVGYKQGATDVDDEMDVSREVSSD